MRHCAIAFALLLVPAVTSAAEDEKGWLGVMIKFEDNKVVVAGTMPDSPADKAKIKEGDVILKIGDFEAKNPEDFVKNVGGRKAGEKVTLTILRDGKEMKIDVKLGKRPPQE